MRTVAFVRSNALGLIAIFIALGGTAVATQVNRTTKVVHVNAEASKKAKAKPGPRGPQGPAGPQGLAGPQGSTGAQGASGLAGVIGRQAGGTASCPDDDQNGDDCASVTLDLPQAGRVLLVGTANWRTVAFDDIVPPNESGDQTTAARGACALTSGGVPLSNTQQSAVEAQGGSDDAWNFDTGTSGAQIATTGVTGSLSAGSHTFTLRCTELDGDLDWTAGRISAVSLGAG